MFRSDLPLENILMIGGIKNRDLEYSKSQCTMSWVYFFE